MTTAHSFGFVGGKDLARMGATWFVSYAYYCNVDSNHTAWRKVKTTYFREGVYNKTRGYHEFWLKQVLIMNNEKLNTNTLRLNALETKRMAKAVLDHCYKK